MSGNTKEWLVVIIFFLCVFGATLVEAFWLSRKNTASFSRALTFSILSNTITVTAGFFVSFVIFGVILAMAWDGSLEKVPAGDFTVWTAVVIGALFPVLLLALAKRLLASVFKLALARPSVYSTASALLFFFIIIGVPTLFIYLI